MGATGIRFGLLALLTVLTTAGCGQSVLDAYEETDATVAPAPSSPASSTPAPATDPPRPSRTVTPRPSKTPRPSSPPTVAIPKLRVPPSYNRAVSGGDVSWPQCPKGMGIPEKPTLGLPMPLASAEFVILGLTNGPAFTPNPCLADQVRWVKERHLMVAAYAVNSYPDDETLATYGSEGPYDGSTRLGALRNVGYQQARFNLGTMSEAGLLTPMIWLDVEPVPIFEWSTDTAANAAVVEGAARGYTDAGYQIGAYSTPALWETVVGDFTLGGVPEWRAAGQTSQGEALARCGSDWSFQGGPGVIGQWVESNRDLDITCPGAAKQMFRWFAQY
jgi:hypothetical protein